MIDDNSIDDEYNFVFMSWIIVKLCFWCYGVFCSWANWFNDECEVKLGVLGYELNWIIHDEIDKLTTRENIYNGGYETHIVMVAHMLLGSM